MMELVSKPNATSAVQEHFGFKPNDCGEPLNLDEPVYRICCKTAATKSSNTTNMHLHLKHNHPMQFSQLGKQTTTKATLIQGPSLSSQQSTITLVFSRQNTNRTVQNGAHSQTVQFTISLKRCSPLMPAKSQRFDKCCKHLTASTNCLGEHTCHKRQFHNCIEFKCNFC